MFLFIQKWRGNKAGLSCVGFAIPLLAKSYYVSLTLNRSSRPSSEVSGKYTGLQFPVSFLDSTDVNPVCTLTSQRHADRDFEKLRVLPVAFQN